jgi:hypothetical protein
MSTTTNTPTLLEPVALLNDRREDGLSRGQVGTVIEALDGGNVLVEFSDDDGRAYAVISCAASDLITLHYAAAAE